MASATARQLNSDQGDLFLGYSNPMLPNQTIGLPSFDRIPTVSYAHAARLAGRINASAISENEHRALLAERQQLLDKQLMADISPKEFNRLEYVRWSLDRIEDAKHGSSLDFLEDAVTRYESLLSELHVLEVRLRQFQPNSKKSK